MALQRLGPFELRRVLGRGGMGTVYEAQEIGRDELVAVKALSPTYSFDEHFRNRFEAEIDALMSLDHENIVRLLSYGQDEGNLYFAMELVDGTSLFQEQKQGQVFHWQEIIDIGIQVCDGLRHAHDRGIIHRDLKPGNLMIDDNRQVKIADFGIAKSFGASSLTSEGNVLGTMDFMAPEQARGQNTTARSDLFSLGAVLYSLLAGRPPFLRDSVEQTFEALLSPNPPDRLNKVAPDIPEPLARLIHRLMEKDPSRRIATAQATSRQLAHVRDQVLNAPKMETQVVQKDSEISDGANTRVVADHATGQNEFGDTADKSDSRQQLTQPEANKSGNSANGGVKPETIDIQSRQPDYFNEVTQQQRQKKSEIGSVDQESSSIWPVLLALVAVLAIFAAGAWFALRRPGMEELLARIRMSESKPVKIQEEVENFIKWYPDGEEIEYVKGLRDRIEVSKYCNTLRSRKKISTNNPLTQIEAKFLAIFDLSRENVPDALDQINPFLLLYGQSGALTQRDERAIELAKQIRVYWTEVAEEKIAVGTQYILDGLKQARDSGNKDNAIAIYDSIIQMYGADAWAEDLVNQAREELEKLKNHEHNSG